MRCKSIRSVSWSICNLVNNLMDQDILHFKLGDDFFNVGCVKHKCLLLVMLHLYNFYFFLWILFNVLAYERHF